MEKKIANYIFLFCVVVVVLHLIYINRSIKRQDVVGFYYGIYNKASVMLTLDADGIYHYAYMHKDGTNVYCSGNWKFYIDERKSARVTFSDMRHVASDNIVPNERYLDVFFKRNIWGKMIFPADYDAGMILFKQ